MDKQSLESLLKKRLLCLSSLAQKRFRPYYGQSPESLSRDQKLSMKEEAKSSRLIDVEIKKILPGERVWNESEIVWDLDL